MVGRRRLHEGVVTVRLKHPRPPEPPAPRWQWLPVLVFYLAGMAVLFGGFAVNLVWLVVTR